MLISRNRHTVFLLFVLTQKLVIGSIEFERIKLTNMSKAIISAVQLPWIKGIDSSLYPEKNYCAKEIVATLNAIRSQETWALNMLDASSKMQSGILKGNIHNLGAYDQCIEVNGEYNGTNIHGEYCTISFGILTSAVCVPSSCNNTQVAELVNVIIENIPGTNELNLGRSNVSCMSIKSRVFTAEEFVTIFFIFAVIVFIGFCTICEIIKKYKPEIVSPVIQLLSKFSLYTNAMALLSTRVTPKMMPAIQGIRFLTMCWVISSHHYLFVLFSSQINRWDIHTTYNSWSSLYFKTGPFSVDTFFLISGFIMTYSYLKIMHSGGRFNFPIIYLHRYLRLTPPFAVFILILVVFNHRMGDGPIWDSLISTHVEPCRKNWWINLLYLQNFVRINEPCLQHFWYLAVDMQLFWISPIILYPLHRWPKFGFGILCFFLIASVVTPTIILTVNGYSNFVFSSRVPIEKFWDNLRQFHNITYNRGCPYFVGILLGYDAANRKRNLSQMIVAIYWITACILMLVCGSAIHYIQNTEYNYNVVLETVSAFLLRPFWSIAIAWIVYACIFGYGGPVTRFLSLPIFLPLGRLSYCTYVVHVGVLGYKLSITQVPEKFSNSIVIFQILSEIIISIAVAFILSLFFEAPIVVFGKILKDRRRNPKTISEHRKNVNDDIDDTEMTAMNRI